jgi:hypothetical protein
VTPSNRRTRGRKAPEVPIVRLEALDAKRRADAALAELRLERESGKLIEVADVEAAQIALVTATKAALLAVPKRATLVGLPREYEELVRGLIVEALRELSGGKA